MKKSLCLPRESCKIAGDEVISLEWIELTIDSASQGIELLETALTMNGYDSFIVDDAEEFEVFLETNRDYWDIVDESVSRQMAGLSRVRLYLEDGPAAQEEIARLRSVLDQLKADYPEADLGTLALSLANTRDEDWENSWKQYYVPIEIGERLLVVPKWMDPETHGRIPVRLDPGMIFGTGAHASTQMCMRRLETLIHGGESVLDLGSGSGILSITALLLGAKHATGVDVDPKAEDIARENAEINGIFSDRFTAVTGNVVTEQQQLSALFSQHYDVVCLNIFADVIVAMAPVLPQFLEQDSVLICSGVLSTRMEEVRSAMEKAQLRILELTEENDWCCFTAKKQM